MARPCDRRTFVSASLSLLGSSLGSSLLSGCEEPAASPPNAGPSYIYDFFVSPTGGTGTGSIDDPWSLAYAIGTGPGTAAGDGKLTPGKHVALRGGTYGTATSVWTVSVAGTAAAPIHFRAYNPRPDRPGRVEDAKIDGKFNVGSSSDPALGRYIWLWGLHFITTLAEPLPGDFVGFLFGDFCKVINCFDDGTGGIYGQDIEEGSEYYGVIVRHHKRTVSGNSVHCFYHQNSATMRKYIRDCMALDAAANDAGASSFGIHAFTTNPPMRNITFERCIALQCSGAGFFVSNGGPGTGGEGFEMLNCVGDSNIPGGTLTALGIEDARTHHDIRVENCYLGTTIGGAFSQEATRIGKWDTSFIFRRNHVWGARVLLNARYPTLAAFPNWWTIEDNTYTHRTGGLNPFTAVLSGGSSNLTLEQWRAAHNFDLNATITASATGEPTVDKVFVGANNAYEPGRANVCCFNHTGASTMPIPAAEVARVLNPGDSYEVRDARDFFGAAVAAGTWTPGSAITVPVNRTNGPGNPFVLLRM